MGHKNGWWFLFKKKKIVDLKLFLLPVWSSMVIFSQRAKYTFISTSNQNDWVLQLRWHLHCGMSDYSRKLRLYLLVSMIEALAFSAQVSSCASTEGLLGNNWTSTARNTLALLNGHPHTSVRLYRAIKEVFECGGGKRESVTQLEMVPSITVEPVTRRGRSRRANCNRCSQSVVLVPAGAGKLPLRRTQPSEDDTFPLCSFPFGCSRLHVRCLRDRNIDRNVSRHFLCLARCTGQGRDFLYSLGFKCSS